MWVEVVSSWGKIEIGLWVKGRGMGRKILNVEIDRNGEGGNGSEEKRRGERNLEQSEGMRRIWINKELDKKLDGILKRVNDGFDGGKISRTQIVTWQLTRWSETCSDRDIETIRLANVNDLSLLEAIIRKAKESGEIPQDLRLLIRKQLAGALSPKK
jgi:hypothetical protein